MSEVKTSMGSGSDSNFRNALKYCYHYQSFDEELSKLNRFWDSISTIGSINQDLLHGHGTPLLESMRETRENFTSLQGRLLQSLVNETLSKATSELSFFAQNTIDVLIRNLFERTADVGYLAIDEDVGSFLSGEGEISQHEMRIRLQAYVQKYSVYDEILILDPQGNVKAQLDTNNAVDIPDSGLINRINAEDEYLEFYGYTSFYPTRPNSHLFASRIISTGEEARHLGYLVMFFRFEDELSRIYQQMLSGEENIYLQLIDHENRVISSSHEKVFPVGEKTVDYDGCLDRPIYIDNKEYLSVSLVSQGYQGYFGLDWTARALIPLGDALDVQLQKKRSGYDTDDVVLLDSLNQIYQESHDINRKLRIVTVNGKSLAARLEVRTFVPILEKIQEVGNEMTSIISDSIGMLSQTVLSSILADCRLYSALAIDIMDRNLYERANDCRWWALTPSFIKALEQGSNNINDDTRRNLNDALLFINDLYTVYTNIIIFGVDGEIIACSKDDGPESIVGKKLSDSSFVSSAAMLPSPQSYSVTSFSEIPEYSGKPTYLYGAAIRNENHRPVAGVAVVFDSEPEFKAMLDAALPKDDKGDPLKGAGGIYVLPNGLIISSTSSDYAVGSVIKLPIAISNLAEGESFEGIVTLEGHKLLMGATASAGYREYKTTGDYENKVIAIIYVEPNA